MKFYCNNCQQKYSIADEKAAGKVLKIRCRKCKSIIVVRGARKNKAALASARREDSTRMIPAPQLEIARARSRGEKVEPESEPGEEATKMMSLPELERNRRKARAQVRAAEVLEKTHDPFDPATPAPQDDPFSAAEPDPAPPETPDPETQSVPRRQAKKRPRLDPVEPPPPPPEAADDVEWYAVIRGTQEGPLTAAQLRGEFAKGRVTVKTYVWCDGMDEWLPIAKLPEVKALVAPGPPKQTESAAPAPGRGRKNGMAKQTEVTDPHVLAEISDVFGTADLDGLEDESSPTAAQPEMLELDPEEVASAPPVELEAESTDEAEPKFDPFAEVMEEEDEGDPFASVPDASDPDAPPRETTQMFIRASGVNKRTSPLRIGGFVLGLAAIVGGMGWFASAAGVDIGAYVPLPGVKKPRATTHRPDMTPEEQERMRQKLLGLGKDPAEVEEVVARRPGRNSITSAMKNEPDRVKEVRKVKALSDGEKSALAALYGDTTRKTPKIEVKGDRRKTDVDSTESPIDPAAVQKAIANTQRAFQNCVQQELRRNPRFKGGRITLTISVAPSGIVKKAKIDDRTIDQADVGKCIRRTSKRMMLPSFAGDDVVDFEVPLLLSTGF